MEVQSGDWVKASTTGDIGKVIHISRLTVFVAIPVAGKGDRVAAFLESQLTKTNRPDVAGQGRPAMNLVRLYAERICPVVCVAETCKTT